MIRFSYSFWQNDAVIQVPRDSNPREFWARKPYSRFLLRTVLRWRLSILCYRKVLGLKSEVFISDVPAYRSFRRSVPLLSAFPSRHPPLLLLFERRTSHQQALVPLSTIAFMPSAWRVCGCVKHSLEYLWLRLKVLPPRELLICLTAQVVRRSHKEAMLGVHA